MRKQITSGIPDAKDALDLHCRAADRKAEQEATTNSYADEKKRDNPAQQFVREKSKKREPVERSLNQVSECAEASHRKTDAAGKFSSNREGGRVLRQGFGVIDYLESLLARVQ